MSEKAGLYKKMLAVMKDVEYLQKDDQVKYKEVNYKAISEEKVTSAVRASLVKNELVIFPVEQEHSKEGMLTTVNTRYKIVDTETGEAEFIVSSGTGVDTQDKGVGKAMTYSYKYLLLRTFAIPTGDDPDKVSSEELTDKLKGNGKPSGQGNPPPNKPQQNTGQNNQSTGQNSTDGPSDKEFGEMVDGMTQKTCTDPTCKTSKTVLPQEVIDFSLKKFGKVLCRYCQGKHKSA